MNDRFDAIVIGSGISGGWAAKELCDRGLKTLLLERGRDVTHIKDYPTANKELWELPYRGRMPYSFTSENPIVSRAWHFGEDTAHFFVKDTDHPYIQKKPFDWIRGYQVGGKSLIWGRASQRWSEQDFRAPFRDGYGIDWPIGYEDIAPWYSHVERFAGICGGRDGVPSAPDGEYLPPFELNVVEKHMQRSIESNFPGRRMVQGRWAHITEPQDIHRQQGRGRCMSRNLCTRGCPLGGYFSSNASTIPWAEKTGNLTLRPRSVVHSILYDAKSAKASGVKVIDAQTMKEHVFRSRVVFLNASTLNTNLILMNSMSERFPNGLGNDNGLLGKYICFHNYRPSVYATIEGFEDRYVEGRNPSGPIIPNYSNFGERNAEFLGGYLTFAGAIRTRNTEVPPNEPQSGVQFKHRLSEPGKWTVYMYMQGETIPKESNRVALSNDKKDAWGIPQLEMDVSYDENDERMIKAFHRNSRAMMEKIGCKEIVELDNKQAPGLDIHEMGGVRMGRDPKDSLLNEWNQLHLCRNVFVTDGACMASTGPNSPSVLYMALTARAANHAADEIKAGSL